MHVFSDHKSTYYASVSPSHPDTSSRYSVPGRRARPRSSSKRSRRSTSSTAIAPWTYETTPASDVQFDIHETHLPISGERDSDWLVRTWNQARVRATRSKNGFVLVLDEIQKIPKWSDTVKGLWDTDRARGCPLHVILLGSAPLLMQSGLSESLAGRFEPVQVTHWSFSEMSQAFDFDLQQYIYFGGYPGCAGFIDDQERWRNYILEALIKSNIERDVLAMTRVDKPALLKRFFDLGSDYSGQILSYTKMVARLESAGNTTTLARYLDLLTDAGLLTGLQGYSNRPVQRRTSSPKLNVLNTALMTAGSGYDFHKPWRIAHSGVESSRAQLVLTYSIQPPPTSASITGGTADTRSTSS